MPRKRKEEVTIEPGKGLNLDPELIKQLVPGTLDRATINEQLAALKKAIFERALGGELGPVRFLVCRGHETITEITSYDRCNRDQEEQEPEGAEAVPR
ncbi:hypothetical protein A8F60_26740 [Burkholderia cenocepacia]|nr:hypothetical protein A8F60_26740 [Burkholderia cenocepacia]